MSGTERHKAARATAKLSLLLAATAAVCLGQPLPSDSGLYAARVMELTGQVSVLKDSTPWALNVGDQIQVKQLIITGPDGQAKFQVSDGSTFDVYPNSRVVFRKNAPNWRDLLDVLVGRVKVHIEHMYGPNPNRVLTPTAVISVRGTTFDISVEEEDETTTVEVEEGLVEVQHALLPRGNIKLLTPSDGPLRVYRNEPIASSRIDKGNVAKRVMRAAVDAISTWESRIPRVGSAGPTGPGDSGHKLPPPPVPTTTAPPPPPPPPAGHFTDDSGDRNLSVFVVHQHPAESRVRKITRVVWTAMARFLLGPEPGLDVMRAIQN